MSDLFWLHICKGSVKGAQEAINERKSAQNIKYFIKHAVVYGIFTTFALALKEQRVVTRVAKWGRL